MRSFRNASRVWPDMTSTSRPTTSVARPYSQWSPGWKLRGRVASRFSMSPTVSPGSRGATTRWKSGWVMPR